MGAIPTIPYGEAKLLIKEGLIRPATRGMRNNPNYKLVYVLKKGYKLTYYYVRHYHRRRYEDG